MKPTTQELIAALALFFMGVIALALIVHVVPADNHDYLLIILGALGGAMGVTGGPKAVAAVTGDHPTTNITGGGEPSAPLGDKP